MFGLDLNKAKALTQFYKIKREMEATTIELEENGIKAVVGGFFGLSEPKVKSLVINGVENKALVEAVNKALKRAFEASLKKLKESGMADNLGM